MRTQNTTSPTNARGFSLIEIMVAVAIVAILVSIGGVNYGKMTCKASKTEALSAMSAVSALEEAVRAEKDGYKQVASTCPARSTTCVVFQTKGKRSNFNIAADITRSGYLVTARGKPGTSQAGAVWRMDQTRAITDVTGLCR